MPAYVTLYKYNGPVTGAGPKRYERVKRTIEEGGGEVLHVYGLLGPWDAMSICNYPDNATAMKVAAKLANLLRAETHTMPAIERDEFLEILGELH